MKVFVEVPSSTINIELSFEEAAILRDKVLGPLTDIYYSLSVWKLYNTLLKVDYRKSGEVK